MLGEVGTDVMEKGVFRGCPGGEEEGEGWRLVGDEREGGAVLDDSDVVDIRAPGRPD